MWDKRTPTIEAYEHNEALRARYIDINALTHVEAWEDDDGMFYPAMCTGNRLGFAEDGRTFATEEEVTEWARRYCPELPVR